MQAIRHVAENIPRDCIFPLALFAYRGQLVGRFPDAIDLLLRHYNLRIVDRMEYTHESTNRLPIIATNTAPTSNKKAI